MASKSRKRRSRQSSTSRRKRHKVNTLSSKPSQELQKRQRQLNRKKSETSDDELASGDDQLVHILDENDNLFGFVDELGIGRVREEFVDILVDEDDLQEAAMSKMVH